MAKTSPVRWWRDDETRYEPRAFPDRRHFNLSEIPRGDDPELDAFVEHWRDTHGFFPSVPMVPLEFETLEPQPGIEVRYPLKIQLPPMLSLTMILGELA